MDKIRNQSDVAWKEILDAYFKDFVEYCLPELYVLINWKKQWHSLDKELQAITKGADSGKRLLDKLFKIFLKDGCEQWVLVHLEIQGNYDSDFPKRMFIYGYRIYDKYQKPIVSCAILTDEAKNWRPSSFQVGLVGSYLRAEYLVVKLIDYQGKSRELESSINPFASVILIQLAALDAKDKAQDKRKRLKFALTRRLYDKGFKRTEVVSLYKFIDWLIGLSKPLEVEYLHEIYEFEETTKMPYISNAEKFGIEKGKREGKREGKLEGKLEVARHLLAEGIKQNIIQRTTGLSPAHIRKLQQEIKSPANKQLLTVDQ